MIKLPSRPSRLFDVVLALAVAGGVTLGSAAQASAATRDIRVHLTNNSDSTLTFASDTLDHGCWSTEPPASIAIGQTVDIASESCGVATGTEFHVSYTVDRTGKQMSLHYDNPFVGSDSFDESAPQGYRFAAGGVIEDRSDTFECTSQTCDGIPDDWKLHGVTIDPGGGDPAQFVDLPKMAVSTDRPTVMVQMDWMQDANHDQHLSQAAIDAVINAFDQDPVTYRGATRPGITLRVDNGPNSTITPGGATWGSLSRSQSIAWTQDFLTGTSAGGYQLANFYTLLKNNFVPTGRLPIFHYAVAAAEISASGTSSICYKGDATSGLTPGDRLGFISTLGDWTGCVGSRQEQTGTFMHEFGHTLGLDHSGGEGNGDSVNRKPNYPSVMNYPYQMVGVFRNGTQVQDYSRDDEPAVDEAQLTEAGGVSLGSNNSHYGTTHSCWSKDAVGKVTVTSYVQATLSPVDWNCDKNSASPGTGFDGNGDNSQTTLKASTSDWSRIQFITGGVGAGENAKDTVTIPSSGVSEPHFDPTYDGSRLIRVLPLETVLTYTGATTGDFHDPATVSARLVDHGAGDTPVQGRTIAFRLGSNTTDVCSAATDATGTASCAITPTQAAGAYPITASFAGDDIYKAAPDAGQTFTIAKEETTTAYIGDLKLANGAPANLAGKLQEDGTTPIAGASLTLTVGSGTTQQSCTAATDSTGVARCTIPTLNQPLDSSGTLPLGAAFAGDKYYQPSEGSATGVLTYMTGRAFGLSADVGLLLSLVHVPPVPDTGDIRKSSAFTTRTPCVVSVGLLLVSAHSVCANVTISVTPGKSVATSGVQDVTIGVPGLPIIKATALRSVSTTTCGGSSGEVSILDLTVGGVHIDTKAAPNTGIDLGGLARLMLNEQLPVPGADHGLTVNALHLTALGGSVDVVVASSTSDIHNC
jgi:hypothetical protein